jgi:hypothetical protein
MPLGGFERTRKGKFGEIYQFLAYADDVNIVG